METNIETINDNKNNIFISESKNEKALTHKFSSFIPSKRSRENHKKRDTIRSIKTFIIDLLKNYANKLIEHTELDDSKREIKIELLNKKKEK